MDKAERLRRLFSRTHTVTPRPAADAEVPEEAVPPQKLDALPLQIEDAPRLPHLSQTLVRRPYK